MNTVGLHEIATGGRVPRSRVGLGCLSAFFLIVGSVVVTGWGQPTAVAQQRNPLQTIGTTVAELELDSYRFERFTVGTPDGQRHWRVVIGTPLPNPLGADPLSGDQRGNQVAPPAGFRSFWMLDANAALIEFDTELLAELAALPQPPALVFIGYDNDLRIDSAARTRDYTPVQAPKADRDQPHYDMAGGADAFLEVIERQIVPEVARRVALDPNDKTLWAHSLGGMLVLHALFQRSGTFDTYISGSPSMWWGDGYLATAAERFILHNAGRQSRVIIHLGGAERVGDRGVRDLSNPRVVAHLQRIQAAPPDAAWQLSETLWTVPGLTVQYREFADLGHGPMFRASLMGALNDVYGVRDRSQTPRPPSLD